MNRQTDVIAQVLHEDAQNASCTMQYADGDVETWPLDPIVLEDARARAAAHVSSQTSGHQSQPQMQRPTFLFPGLRATPFWPCEAFPQTVSVLEAAAPGIRREVLRMLAAVDDSGSSGEEDVDMDAENIAEGRNTPNPRWQPQREGLHEGVWQKLELWAHGSTVAENCAAVPSAAAAVAAAPDAMLQAPGRAALSMMLPGVNVRPHCGPTNHRLRLHLPILLPGDAYTATGLSVAGEERVWVRGKCLIFDDSFEHQVKLTADAVDGSPLVDLARVVLIVDLWHPDASKTGLRPEFI